MRCFKLIFVMFLSAGVFFAPHKVQAEPVGLALFEADQRVCVSKHPEGLVELGFVVFANDAQPFFDAGFRKINCPDITQDTVRHIHNKCLKIQKFSPEALREWQPKYGISFKSACRAEDVYLKRLVADNKWVM